MSPSTTTTTPPSPKPIRIGLLVPSSNTALEPLTTSIISSLPSTSPPVTLHYSRFPVTTISLSPTALSQFSPSAILPAAHLLADAAVDIIAWCGTSAGWLGFSADEELCRAIEEETGVRATTSVLALNKALRVLGVKRLGLVTPYTLDVQEAIIANYAGIGVDISSERHLSRTDNVNMSLIGANEFDKMVEGVVREEVGSVDTVTTFCTNLMTAKEVERWEAEFGVPVLDMVTVVVWDALRSCGVDTRGVEGWGVVMEKGYDEDGTQGS